MALITRKEAAEKMGVTIQAVYMAIKQGRLTAMEDNQGNIVINDDTMVAEWNKKSAFRQMKSNPQPSAPKRNLFLKLAMTLSLPLKLLVSST